MAPGRMRYEWVARALVLALMVGLPAAVLGIGWGAREHAVEVHAAMPEAGGWSPDNLTIEAGQPLHLQLTSDDVLHGFAVGMTDWPPVDVKPGQVTELTLTFDEPGTYTFYCTHWCGLNHWRMRGIIEVTGPVGPHEQANSQALITPPLYVTLGLDLDAPHLAPLVPTITLSVARGAIWGVLIPTNYLNLEYYQSHSPAETWQAFRKESVLSPLNDEEIWDLVAWVWAQNTSPEELKTGARLYAQNCAACHGETGAGDGIFADVVGNEGAAMAGGTLPPTAFSDPRLLLGASPALLQGKIIRGGMGTGMPYWGTIFTQDQGWALVSFLYSFQFDEE
jgi:mono/diheme cytochrome c family protein/plastocyanin